MSGSRSEGAEVGVGPEIGAEMGTGVTGMFGPPTRGVGCGKAVDSAVGVAVGVVSGGGPGTKMGEDGSGDSDDGNDGDDGDDGRDGIGGAVVRYLVGVNVVVSA